MNMDRDFENDMMNDMERAQEEKGGRKFGGARKKPCRFCTDNEYIADYKQLRTVTSFMTEHGRIVPRRVSGCCAFHQRRITDAIKRARMLALVGFVSIN